MGKGRHPHHTSSKERTYNGYEIEKILCKYRPYVIPKGNLAYTYKAHIHAPGVRE